MAFLFGLLKVLFYGVIAAVISVVGVAYFFMTWEPDRRHYALRGIDVSHHNGTIYWPAVAKDDVAFVYIKATEGDDVSDPAFQSNWEGAGKAGLARGAYHFFSFCSPPEAQARFFLSRLSTRDAMLPPMLDLEMPNGQDCAVGEPAAVRAAISLFVARVERESGAPMVLYAPEDFFRQYLQGQGLKRPFWARSLWRSPSYADDWLFWQYQARGQVRGIDTDVDLNVLSHGKSLESLMVPPRDLPQS